MRASPGERAGPTPAAPGRPAEAVPVSAAGLETSTPGRVLVRAPNWLGDTVMAVPLLRALRHRWPAAEVLCVGRWVPALLEGEPGLVGTREYPRAWRARLGLARELRRMRVDVAVLLPNSFEAALFAWLAGARSRVGYAGDGRTALLTHPVPPPRGRVRQVDAYLALLGPLGAAPASDVPTLGVAGARRAEARRLLASVGVPDTARPVALSLGAAFGPSKLWPPEGFAALAARLLGEGRAVVLVGDASAAGLAHAVQARLATPVPSLVGRDHPALLPALLGECAVVVTPDSGPAHVAAAVGVPAVTLFGPTDPRLTAPAGPGHTALWQRPPCAPCFLARCPIDHRCMRAISADAVLAAVRSRLEASR
jgi:heptosyltransferase-2